MFWAEHSPSLPTPHTLPIFYSQPTYFTGDYGCFVERIVPVKATNETTTAQPSPWWMHDAKRVFSVFFTNAFCIFVKGGETREMLLGRVLFLALWDGAAWLAGQAVVVTTACWVYRRRS
jgi:hypothetical protein